MFDYIEFTSIRNISKDLDNMLETKTSSVFSFKQTIIVYIEHFKCQWKIFMETFWNDRIFRRIDPLCSMFIQILTSQDISMEKIFSPFHLEFYNINLCCHCSFVPYRTFLKWKNAITFIDRNHKNNASII